jgi:hypothetical protein
MTDVVPVPPCEKELGSGIAQAENNDVIRIRSSLGACGITAMLMMMLVIFDKQIFQRLRYGVVV